MTAFPKSTKSILIGLVCLTYTGLFFPIGVSTITLVLLLAFCVIRTRPVEYVQTFKANPFSKIMTLLYLVLVVGLLYTTNYKAGFFVLEKRISLLLIPLLVLPLLQKVNIGDSAIFRNIGYITVLSSVVLLCVAGFKRLVLGDPRAFYYEEYTSIHYVYYAMYFACGSLMLIDALFDELMKKRFGLLYIFLLFAYSTSILVLVASKTGILAFGFASVVFFFKKIRDKKLVALSILLLLLSVSCLLYFNKTSRNRFVGLTENLSILKYDDMAGRETVITDLNMRLLFWKISLVNAWHDRFILTGVGTGDVQAYLDSLYTSPKYQLYGYVGYDSHNEWVFTIIQLGLMGFLAMALLFFKYLKDAMVRNDLKFLIFLIVSFAFSLSESILESNKGIVFFSLLITLFCASYNKKVPASIVQP